MKDDHVYGLGKQDMSEVVQLIGSGDREYLEGVVRSRGGTIGGRLYRFTLNASLASGTADADILEMDGTDTGTDADVLDPLGIFASLVTVGDAGLCLLQNGNYYVIQALCPA